MRRPLIPALSKAWETFKQTPLGAQVLIHSELTKVKLTSLVVTSTGMGYAMVTAPLFTGPGLSGLATVMGGTLLCAASANTLNQIFEVASDAKMHRTMNRPLPSGRTTKTHAYVFAGLTAAAGGKMLYGIDPVVMALGWGNIALYSCVYTPMKQWSHHNTTIGSLVGAIPPLMGVVAGSVLHNGMSGMEALLAPENYLLGAFLFFWQAPHFYAMSWYQRHDYSRGGHAMVSVKDENGTSTARLITGASIVLAGIPFGCHHAGLTDAYFTAASAVPNMGLLALAAKFHYDRGDHTARLLFRYSNWYLLVIMALFALFSRRRPADNTKCAVCFRGSPEMCVHEAGKSLGAPTCTEASEAAGAVKEGMQDAVEAMVDPEKQSMKPVDDARK